MTIFEKIVAGELPCNKVLESEKFLAFNDINPKAPIHILIIPKKHFENFQEMDGALMGEMTKFIQEVAVLMGVDKSGMSKTRHTIKAYLYDNLLTPDPNDFTARVSSERSLSVAEIGRAHV